MEPFPSYPGESTKCQLKSWARALYLGLAAIIAALDFFLVYLLLFNPQTPRPLLFIAAILFFLAAYLTLLALRTGMSLNQQEVSVSGAFLTRTLRLDAVKGRRTVSTRNGNYTVIEGKGQNDPNLTIPGTINLDDAGKDWMRSLPDLDLADREEVLQAISTSEELGATPEARLQALKQAKIIVAAITVTAIAAAVTLWLLRASIDISAVRAIAVVLALIPWLVLWLQMRSPLLYAMIVTKGDPRPTLFFALVAAAFGLISGQLPDSDFAEPFALFGYGCIPGILLCLALYRASKSRTRPVTLFLWLLAVSCAYGYGLIAQANVQLDASSPQETSTEVLETSISRGRSTTYYLTVTSWQPAGYQKKISVSQSLYNSTNAGDLLCVTTHAGALRLGWYTLHQCDWSHPPS